VRARLLGAGCDGLGWLIDLVGIRARVRAPALSRRLSSFLFVGWLPHAKYAPWGRLGLTPGDPRFRSQFRRRTLQTGVDRRRPVEDIDWKVVSELQSIGLKRKEAYRGHELPSPIGVATVALDG
jgi:hypothetical protein